MPNYCSVGRPSWMTQQQWDQGNDSSMQDLAYDARYFTEANPFIFNADTYRIKCAAFPAQGGTDPFITQQAAITQLQTSVASVQTDVNTLKMQVGPVAAASHAASSGGVMTTQLQVEYFGAVLAFLAVVWLADRVRRYFWRDGGDHV